MGLTKRKKGFAFRLFAAEYVRVLVVNTTTRSNLDNTGARCQMDMELETDMELVLELELELDVRTGYGLRWTGDGTGDGDGDLTACWNWIWTRDETGEDAETELHVGNRTVYLACVYKLVSVVRSDINSCFVLPWRAISPNAKLLSHPSLPVSSQ